MYGSLLWRVVRQLVKAQSHTRGEYRAELWRVTGRGGTAGRMQEDYMESNRPHRSGYHRTVPILLILIHDLFSIACLAGALAVLSERRG